MKRLACLVATLLVLVGTVSAQDESRDGGRGRGQQRGGPGGGPGGGGPGGGRGGPGGGWGGGGGSPMGGMGGDAVSLLRVTEVQEELKLEDDQKEALKTIAESLRPERPEGVDVRSMGEEERREFFTKMQADMKEKMETAKGQLSEVLSPGQMERLDQISLQVRGAGALEDPAIIEELELTKEQQDELAKKRDEIRDTMRDRMRELFQNGNRDPEQFQKIRAEIEDDVLSVLTSDQRSEFDAMKGDPFKMPERSAMGGGRGGRGGERGGRGGDRGGRGGDRGGRPDGDSQRGGGGRRPQAE